MDSSFTLLSRQKCRWAAGATLAVAMAGSPFVVASPAVAVGSGTFEVHVNSSLSGSGLDGQSVRLYSTATGLPVGAAVSTSGGGDAVFTALDAGGYTAKVTGTASYFEKYSTVVTIDGDGDFESQTVFLTPATVTQGRITGKVTKATSQLDAEIQIFPSTATTAAIASGDVEPVAASSANYYGYYGEGTSEDTWATKLPPGSYKVLVGDDDTARTTCHGAVNPYYGYCEGWSEHETQVWVGSGGTNDVEHGQTFVVTAASTRTIPTVALPAVVEPPAENRIEGTVTGTGAAPLEDIEVNLFQQQPDLSWEIIDGDQTWDDGKFGFSTYYDDVSGDFVPLPAGVYTVSFNDDRAEYAAEFNGDKPTNDPFGTPPEDAALITLAATGKQTVDAGLAVTPVDLTSGLNGKVTNDLNVAHPGFIQIFDNHGNQVFSRDTRRTGVWSIPATQLAPGSYKVVADDGIDVGSWYGGTTYNSATTFVVPVKGAKAAGNSKLLRYGSISGSVNLAAGAGDSSQTGVTIYDENGEPVDGDYRDGTGAYSFGRQRPGTYYVSATGARFSSFDDTDAQVSWLQYIKQFWKSKYTLGTATPITVVSGGNVTGVNITLGRTLLATAKPSIVKPSTIKVGTILKPKVGTWNVRSGLTYSYTWKRGTKVVGHAATYKVVKGDKGKTLTLTVTATDTRKEYATGSAVSKGVKVPA